MIKEQKSSSSSSPSQKPKHFPIPNLKDVLQCYDVSEPIIHPPAGSNPFATFMNRNPDKGCGLTPISPTDIDPCVGVVSTSCCEIFSKTTDLTASEHAGVSLSEHTTMVSTATSDSSEVLAQETVNHLDKFKPISSMDVDSRVVVETVKEDVGNSVESDVVATNIESNVVVVNKIENDGVAAKTESDIVAENGVVATNTIRQEAGSIVCDVCNVTCTSEKSLMQHTQGKAHIKKSEKLQVSSIKQEPPSPDANGILDQESERKNQNVLQKEASVGSLFFCSIPDLDCGNQKIQSIVTEEVTVPSCVDQLPNSTLLSTALLQPSNGLAQNIDNKLKIHQPTWCEASKANCSSNKCLERHNSEKEHLKKLEDLEKIMSPPSVTSIVSTQSTPIHKPEEDLKSVENKIGDSDESTLKWCEVCKISCTRDDLNMHLSGKKHLKNLRKSVFKANSPSTVNSVESLKLPKGVVVDPNEGNAVWCELCRICSNSHEALNAHISGKKHKRNLMKSEPLVGLSPAPSLATKPLHDPINEESKAVVLESSKRKANGSSANDEDVNTKRQKAIEEEDDDEEEEEEWGVTITCNMCKVVFNSIMGFKVHRLSQEHSAMALKQANL